MVKGPANFLDASMAGPMTTVLGILFLMVYLFTLKQGLFSVFFKERQRPVDVSPLVSVAPA
jgi:manganese/zinc/iron transport system permease protein